MKKTTKTIILLIITLLLIICMTSDVFATIDTSKLQNISKPSNVASLTEMSGKIISAIYAVAVVVSVGMLLVIGIKYITASPDQKASLKDRAVPYLIGAVLVFGAANILKFIEKMSGWIS